VPHHINWGLISRASSFRIGLDAILLPMFFEWPPIRLPIVRLILVVSALLYAVTPLAAEPVPITGEADISAESGPGDWYFFVAAVNVYPELESERLIGDLFEPALRALAPGHGGVATVSKLRDDHLLWPPHIGVGKNLSTRWSAFVEAGYTSGKVHTKTDDTSILLLPLHTNFEIRRGALFAGAGVDFFPWGMPVQDNYHGIRERLAQVRPFLGTRFTVTHATFRAKAKVGLRPFPNFVNLELSDSWTLPSATVVAGFDMPISKNTALTVNAAYNHFWDQEFDFEGYAFTLQWKYFFHGRKPKFLRRG
jgi:hypothetical protein